MSEHIVIFDKPYSPEKIAEGLAVHWAVITGACNSCKYLSACESDASDAWNSLPQDAACAKKLSGDI